MTSRALAIGAVTLGVAALLFALTHYLLLRQPTAAAPTPLRSAPTMMSARDLVAAAGTALEACPLPSAPAVPDSSRASLDEMKAAQAAFAAYDAATTSYTQCVDSAVAQTAKRYAGVASAADLKALDAFGARAHNAAIDQEQAVVDQFNAQVRTYREKSK